jgi:hypothetical protein
MKRIPLRRLAALVISGTLVAVTVGIGTSAGATFPAVPAPAGDSVRLDTQLPGSFGESGVPTPFVAVVTNLGAARPDVQLSLRLTRFHGVSAEHFDIEFRDPATGTWQTLELRDEPDGAAITGSTAPFALAAGVSTLNLRFAYHPGEFDATLLDVREVTFDMALVENGPDGPTTLATDVDIAPVLRMAVYFTGTPARLRAGVSDPFAIRYTNASENRYQPVRPFLFIDPMLSDLNAGNLKLEWQHPRTKAWSVVPLVETGNGPSAQFTEEHAVEVRPQSTATVSLRLTVAKGVTGGRILLRAGGFVPADRDFGLNLNQTYVTVTR